MQEHADAAFTDLSTKIAQAVAPAVDTVLQMPEADLEAVASLTEAQVLSSSATQVCCSPDHLCHRHPVAFAGRSCLHAWQAVLAQLVLMRISAALASACLRKDLDHVQDEDLHQAVLALARMLQLQLIAPYTADPAVAEQLDEKLEVS